MSDSFKLTGTVVPMTRRNPSSFDGVVYIQGERIVDVRLPHDPPPGGFPPNALTVETGGVIYPGFFDLHNHLSYNVLRLWPIPFRSQHRGDWIGDWRYKREISEPMLVLRDKGGPDVVAAIVRYVEVKLLVAGVTSGQGLDPTTNTLFAGLVRNFEAPDAGLPAAFTRVPDLKDSDVASFRQKLDTGFPMFHHVAEGVGGSVHSTFERLQRHGLLQPNLVAIHSLDLTENDFVVMAQRGTGVVWSPFSNAVLYGKTIDPAMLAASGVRVGLGSDWSPSGTRNLLLELKAARLFSDPEVFSDERLAHMVTSDSARIARWDAQLGTLEAGKMADVTVLAKRNQDVFANLINATERDVDLVVINGVARYGEARMLSACGIPPTKRESIAFDDATKEIYLEQKGSGTSGVTVREATAILKAAMADLDAIRDNPVPPAMQAEARALLPLDMQAESLSLFGALVFKLLPPVSSVPFDPLTVAGDETLFATLDGISHAPGTLKGANGLRRFY
jgi:cytosine/adenosine deaminase-related metal-dependent hydrolase